MKSATSRLDGNAPRTNARQNPPAFGDIEQHRLVFQRHRSLGHPLAFLCARQAFLGCMGSVWFGQRTSSPHFERERDSVSQLPVLKEERKPAMTQ